MARVTLLLLAALAATQERPASSQVYKKTEQAELKIHLSFPEDWKRSDRRPAIVFFFGGGWTSGTVEQFAPQATYLARRGMVAARADYRVKSRHQVTPDACVEDAKSAVRWLRKNAADLGIDPDRIVAAGGSAGGHLAACTGTVTGLDAAGEDASISSKPNAMLLFNPVLHADPLISRMTDSELAKKITPNLHLEKGLPPALIFFGTADPLMVGAKDYLAKAKELGGVAELYTAEGQPHGFFNRSPWQERTLYRADEFLAGLGYLQGKPTLELPKGEK
jgi:acetyl esterase/lipase